MQASAMQSDPGSATRSYPAREVVGVFSNPDALEAAVDELAIAGFDRAAISILATDPKAREQIDRFYRGVRDIEDSGRAPVEAFVSRHSLSEAKAAIVGIPLYIGGFAGAAGVAATGGALALAIAATLGGAAAGAGLGALLAVAIAHHRSAGVNEQLNKGGLVLWVTVADPEESESAIATLTKAGARDVHVHEITRAWKLNDAPLAGLALQPDPLLADDGSSAKPGTPAKRRQ
jgi:hypothetical protein